MSKLLNMALEVMCEMHTLKEFVKLGSSKLSGRLTEEWIDSQQAMVVLKIKKRALQNFRDKGMLPFSHVHGKCYYKTSDVEALLKSNYINKNKKAHGAE
jgi:hypothetical protein